MKMIMMMLMIIIPVETGEHGRRLTLHASWVLNLEPKVFDTLLHVDLENRSTQPALTPERQESP